MCNLPLHLALWNDSQLETSSKVLYEKLQNSVPPKVVNKRFPGFKDLIWLLKCIESIFLNMGFYIPAPPPLFFQ